jgi:hypothetical protein
LCDYRRGMDWILDILTHLYTPLGTTLHSPLTHTDWFPQSVTVPTSRFLAAELTQWKCFSFRGHAVAHWLTLHTCTHSATFSASLAEPISRLTAHLELWNSTADSESESYVTTDGQSASLSWNKAPIWGLRPDLYCLTVAGFLIWGALSEERTGLSFTIAVGPCQRSHFRVRVP